MAACNTPKGLRLHGRGRQAPQRSRRDGAGRPHAGNRPCATPASTAPALRHLPVSSKLVFALTPVVPVAAVLLFAAGWMSAAFLAINQTAMQLRVDDSVRGRVLSIYLLTWGMLPIGQLAVGALADRLGAPWAVVVACVLSLGCIAVVARRYPSLRG